MTVCGCSPVGITDRRCLSSTTYPPTTYKPSSSRVGSTNRHALICTRHHTMSTELFVSLVSSSLTTLWLSRSSSSCAFPHCRSWTLRSSTLMEHHQDDPQQQHQQHQQPQSSSGSSEASLSSVSTSRPAMHVRGHKILIYPGEGGVGEQSLETLARKHAAAPHTQQSRHAEFTLYELEVNCMYISHPSLDKMQSWILDRHPVSKLVIRSCQGPADVWRDLLSHFQTRNRLIDLEFHKTSRLSHPCIDAITDLPQLETLTLNVVEAETDLLRHLFARLGRLKRLRVLNLNGCRLDQSSEVGISDNLVVRALATQFQSMAAQSTETGEPHRLEHVSLKCCRLSDQSIAQLVLAMKDLSNLKTLNLVGNRCGHQTLQVLGEILDPCITSGTTKTCTLAKSLNLLDLSHQDDSLVACDLGSFFTALESNDTLRTLRLAGNRLGDATVSLLAQSLQHNNALSLLDLLGNDLGDTGSRALMEALHQNRTLTSLNIKYNARITDLAPWVAVLRSDNFCLQRLEHTVRPLRGEYLLGSGSAREILSYYLHLNRAGRSLLRRGGGDDVVAGLWPTVLERSTVTESKHRCHQEYRLEAVYYFLQNAPILHPQRDIPLLNA